MSRPPRTPRDPADPRRFSVRPFTPSGPGIRTTAGGTHLRALRADPEGPSRSARSRLHAGRQRRATSARRLTVVLGLVVALFASTVARLADLQVLAPDRYVEHGERQRIGVQELAASRGSILDRNGAELAMSVPRATLFVDPELLGDGAAEAARVLAPVLGRDEAELAAELAPDEPGDRFTYLARQLDEPTAARLAAVLEEHELPGIRLMDEPARFRPAGDLARSVIGAVDIDNRGLSGLELSYADALTGTPGELLLERGRGGETIPVGEHELRPPVEGDDLVLTLDRSLQYEVERVLVEQVTDTGAEGGTAIVSDPATGELLAMATVARTAEGEVVVSGDNRATSSVYEPGSVMKVVTVAAALEAGVVEPDTVLTLPYAIQVGDHLFEEHDPRGTVNWTVGEILAQSSNVGTIRIAKMLGAEGVVDGLDRFGFGAATGLGFPGEQGGTVPRADEWWSTSMGSIPIGHSIAATPLQVLCAYNTLANGGVYVPPVLVRATVGPDGIAHPVPAAEGRRVVSEETANALNMMLRSVVAEGTGGGAGLRGYTPAGKTGTARKVQPEGGYTNADGGYDYISTFVGFAPAEDPAVSVIVVIDEPDTSRDRYTGGAVAAPAFARITEFALRHLGVAPPATDEVARALAAAGGDPDGLEDLVDR